METIDVVKAILKIREILGPIQAMKEFPYLQPDEHKKITDAAALLAKDGLVYSAFKVTTWAWVSGLTSGPKDPVNAQAFREIERELDLHAWAVDQLTAATWACAHG